MVRAEIFLFIFAFLRFFHANLTSVAQIIVRKARFYMYEMTFTIQKGAESILFI